MNSMHVHFSVIKGALDLKGLIETAPDSSQGARLPTVFC